MALWQAAGRPAHTTIGSNRKIYFPLGLSPAAKPRHPVRGVSSPSLFIRYLQPSRPGSRCAPSSTDGIRSEKHSVNQVENEGRSFNYYISAYGASPWAGIGRAVGA